MCDVFLIQNLCPRTDDSHRQLFHNSLIIIHKWGHYYTLLYTIFINDCRLFRLERRVQRQEPTVTSMCLSLCCNRTCMRWFRVHANFRGKEFHQDAPWSYKPYELIPHQCLSQLFVLHYYWCFIFLLLLKLFVCVLVCYNIWSSAACLSITNFDDTAFFFFSQAFAKNSRFKFCNSLLNLDWGRERT